MTRQHVQRLWAEYVKTGVEHQQRPAGRPEDPVPSGGEINAVLGAYHRKPEGVIRTAKRLQKEGRNISRSKACLVTKSNGLVVDSPAKSKKRKWIRYERLYSDAMRHADWHAMKDPRMRALN